MADAPDETCMAPGTCGMEACDLRRVDIDSSSVESLIEARQPFIITGAAKETVASLETFLSQYGEVEIIPKVSLETSVDGRINQDNPERPRPSVMIATHFHHVAEQVDSVEDVLYGQALTNEEISERITNINDALKKEEKDTMPIKPAHVNDITKLGEQLLSAKIPSSLSEMNTSVAFIAHSAGQGLPFQSEGGSWHASLLGEQTWYFYPPSGIPKTVAAYHTLAKSVTTQYFETVAKAERPLICTQRAGEIVVVPKFWNYARTADGPYVSIGKQAHHVQIMPNMPELGEVLDVHLASDYGSVPQLHVDKALTMIKTDPKGCVESMMKAVDLNQFNLALTWQVARMLSRLGAKGDALKLASKAIDILTKASGAKLLDEHTPKEDENDYPPFGPVSNQFAKIHWTKFGQMLLYDLQMPLEAIVCFQMRLQLTPNDAPTALLRARALTMMGALDLAKDSLSDFLDTNPDSEEARKMMEELDSDQARNLAEQMKAMRGQGNEDSKSEELALETLRRILKKS
eukprot:CAMPEP_0167764600 /NCGR_PEP_ID=MMETSP0110_2-20121227/14142_1 /TAXON_ID=629695 /ORGANISM="Gymnochlora sp., Strain CCMP2014" /LENGTH=517 /DNA_ID=CAMNT_0007652061 /DNA_START=82 /DNA_END=1635 /DNA_ORIENTATION=-